MDCQTDNKFYIKLFTLYCTLNGCPQAANYTLNSYVRLVTLLDNYWSHPKN